MDMKNTEATKGTEMNETTSILDIVTYEDQMNPRAAYVVTKIIDSQWGRQFGLLNIETDEYVTSDLRQQGWTYQMSAA